MTKQECLDQLDNMAKCTKSKRKISPIDRDIVNDCKLIIDEIETIPEIDSTADGTIQLKYKINRVYIELEVFEDKYILFVSIEDKSASFEIYCREQAIQWWNLLTTVAKHTI